MSFKQYRNSNWVTAYDLDPQGNAVTITSANKEMQENYRTKQQEEKIVLYFAEFKPIVLTNTNLDTLDECFPLLDLETIRGARLWIKPVDIEVGGEAKSIVRIEKHNTLRMQAPPPVAGSPAGPGLGATPSDVPPPHIDGNAPPPPGDQDDIPF